ncbi:uncharacterized protein [Castor canadensis]|uniref:Uncharacterized protein n=1 Tax=Castor canadensis TaxID=51338 RepID=A0AC58KNW9_CASCN
MDENEIAYKAGERQEAKAASRDLQEAADISAVLQHSVDEIYVAPSSCQDWCDVHQTPDTPASTPEEQVGSWILDTDENKISLNAGEGQDAKVSRELNRDASLSAVHQDSLHEQILAPSSCYDLSEFHQPPNTPAFLSEEHMVCSPPAVSENKISYKAGEEQETKAPRKDDGLIQVQVGEVSELLQQLQEKREASFSLSQHLKVLHTEENPDNQQDYAEQLAEACRVVEPFVYMMSAENHDDDDDDDDENSLNSRLNSQPQEEKVKELFTGSSGKEYFHTFPHPDQLDSEECLRGSSLPLDGPKVSPTLSQNTSSHPECLLQPPLMPSSLFLNVDGTESNLDASIEVKKPEMLECDTAEGSVDNIHEFQHGFTGATNFFKQKIIQRILSFSNSIRNECRFPASTCRGWFYPTTDVTSAFSYLEFPWAVTMSVPVSIITYLYSELCS